MPDSRQIPLKKTESPTDSGRAPALRRLLSRILVVALAVTFAGLSWGFRPGVSALTLASLLIALGPLAVAWKASVGSPLRPAVVWMAGAVALGLIAQFIALRAGAGLDRSSAGHWTYVSSLAVLAALISVLGARKPGSTAWALLMGLLVLVFLIPWLEGIGLAGSARNDRPLQLDAPWSIFFAGLAIAGVSNYLPTRYTLAAVSVGASLLIEFLGLLHPQGAHLGHGLGWSLGPFCLACGVILAWGSAASAPLDRESLSHVWLWFRDHWGVVWALRVRERFHAASAREGWSFKLDWSGVVPDAGMKADDARLDEACFTFWTLIRRFASREQPNDLR